MPGKASAQDSKEEILGVSKITSKGQVTIPIDVRTEFVLGVGDRLLFVRRGNELLVKKSK